MGRLLLAQGIGDMGRAIWVAAASEDVFWAAGCYINVGPKSYLDALLLKWDGKAWQQMKSPVPDTNTVLWSVAAVSPDDVWAVGEYDHPQGHSIALHWDGTVWNVNNPPALRGRTALRGVSCAGPADVWAVGVKYESGYMNKLIFHWDGSSWTQSFAPDIGPQDYLHGVFAGEGTVWACGAYAQAAYSAPGSFGYAIPMVLAYR